METTVIMQPKKNDEVRVFSLITLTIIAGSDIE